ncbi:hypothetical protein JCM10450v2_005559 [Rhodotorula kratochvilovae]
MAALTRALTQDELLQLLDPNDYVPRGRRAPPPPPPPAPPPASSHKRTASIASSLASYFADRVMIPSPRPSRPPSTRSRQLPPLLSLPPELLLYILELALPATHTRATTRERNSLLYRLALVHPVLRPYAQGELFSTVFVTSDDMVGRLAKATCVPKSRGNALGGQVRTLRVNGNLVAGDGGKALAALVQQLSGLETLALEDLDGLELRQFVLYPALRSLSATRCGFRSRFRSFDASRSSSLTSLSLTNCTAQHDAFSGFSLPTLTHLRVWDLSLPPPTPMATVEASEAFRSIAADVAPRLQDAAVDAQHLSYLFPPPRASLFRALRPASCALTRLSLIKLASLSAALDALPPSTGSTLRTLHLAPPPSFLPHCTSPERAEAHFGALLSAFQRGGGTGAASVHPALASLAEVHLDRRYGAWLAPPPPFPLPSAGGRAPTPAEAAAQAHAEGHAALVRLVERCSALGVDVRVGQEGDGEDVYGGLRRRGMSDAGAGRGGRMTRWASEGATPGGAVRGGGRFGAADM